MTYFETLPLFAFGISLLLMNVNTLG